MIHDFIEKHGFVILFSQHNGKPYATHLPLMLNKDKTALYGHFARPNGQWKDIEYQEVLVVFHGPHCYISPSWYETTKAVPTWNYMAIHLYGRIEILKNKKEIFDSLYDLTVKYEGSDSLYDLNQVDPNFIEGMSKGITAFKI
jgi:transcriptional regulator